MFGKLKSKLKEWTKKISGSDEEVEKVLEVEEKEKKETKKKAGKTEKKSVEKRTSKKKAEKKKEKRAKKKKEKDVKKVAEEKEKVEEKEKKVEEKKKGREERETLIEEIDEKIEEDFEGGSEEEKEEEPKEKKGFFKKLVSSKKKISSEEFSNYAEDLEMILLENNVALEVVDKIIDELRGRIVDKELSKKEIEEKIKETLKEIVEKVLVEPFDLIDEIKNSEKPYVILFCGINGTGKTTHIAKLAKLLEKEGLSSVMAAGDTFRAAAVEQLKKHGENLGIKVIAHDYGSDPAAVGFDARKYAEKNSLDVVLIDTAGRIHTATNLIKEMEKIKRVTNPNRTIFVGEAITGNDATDQVKAFNDNIGIDGIILSKADIDEKGGTALSVGYTTNKPILFLGTGQGYEDIEKFDKKKFIEKLGLD